MSIFQTVRNWFGPRAGGKSELQQNMEKALKMKQEAGPQTNIPEHATSNDGAIQGGQVDYTDSSLGKEGTFIENTGRSRGARVSDMGKTTGPGR